MRWTHYHRKIVFAIFRINAALLLSAVAAQPALAVKYTVTDLRALKLHWPQHITDAGRILNTPSNVKATIYFNGHSTVLDASRVDEHGLYINDRNQYLASVGNYSVVFGDNGAVTTLASDFGFAMDLSAEGHALYYSRPGYQETNLMRMVKDGVVTEIAVKANGGIPNVHYVNNLGQVLGAYHAGSYSDYNGRFRNHQRGAFIFDKGRVVDLDIGLDAQVYGFNDLGHVIGTANFDNNPLPPDRFIGYSAFVYVNGVITDILPRSEKVGSSRATGINNAGQVIGVYRPPNPNSETISGVFLYEDGKVTDLSELPEVKAIGWVLDNDTNLDYWPKTPSINNAGQIIAYGRNTNIGGYSGAILLTPIPEVDLIASKNPSASAEPVTFTATTPANTGTVSFFEGERLLSTVVLNGSEKRTSYTTSSLPPGSHTITVKYTGVADSSASLVQLVNSALQCR